MINLIGKRFGNLVVIGLLPEKKNENFVYRCQCDCGNIVEVKKGNLTKKSGTKSCGCLSGDYWKKRMHYVDDTELEKIDINKKRQCNNRSGITGVHRTKGGYWYSKLDIKGKRVLDENHGKGVLAPYDAAVSRVFAEYKYHNSALKNHVDFDEVAL